MMMPTKLVLIKSKTIDIFNLPFLNLIFKQKFSKISEPVETV